MALNGFAQAFLTVFPAELPDKTMVASVVLVARYRQPVAVWAGATLAFVVHVTVAVLAGRLLTLLPETPVQLVVAGLFAFGAVALLRAARATREAVGSGPAEPSRFVTAATGSFALVIAAEWGDLTQLATASLAAGGDDPIAIGLGALVALSSVAALAVTVGRQLIARVPLHIVNLVAAAIFAALAVATLLRLVLGA
ncbi:MAG: TMEM165/GDT1 family protein [Acidimicrobiales bacterium]